MNITWSLLRSKSGRMPCKNGATGRRKHHGLKLRENIPPLWKRFDVQDEFALKGSGVSATGDTADWFEYINEYMVKIPFRDQTARVGPSWPLRDLCGKRHATRNGSYLGC